jgi:GntR family transcriptional regulator
LSNTSIDPDDFTPAYYQLARILEKKIMSGEFRPEDRIPSETKLGEEYGLSRITVKKAISLLADEGLLRSERGRGTFVNQPKVDGGLFLIPDFHNEMRNQGVSTRVDLLKVKAVKASGLVSEKLEARKGRKVLYLERILEAGDEPLVFDRKYILYDRDQPLLEAELGHGSTEELFSGSPDLVPLRADLKLTVTSLSEREALLLESREGAPAFCMEQLIYAANDLRVIWGWMIYRGDKFSFESLSRPL